MRQRPDDIEKIEDLKYQLDGTFAKQRRAQKTVEFPQIQLGSIQATVDNYCQRSPDLTERMRTDVTDGFAGFIFLSSRCSNVS